MFVLSIICGVIVGVGVVYTQNRNSSSAEIKNSSELTVKLSDDGQSQATVDSAELLGSPKIGPRSGALMNDVQSAAANVDRIVGNREIQIRN